MAVSVTMNVGQFVTVGPITGETDSGQPAPITNLAYGVVGGDVTLEALGGDSFKVTANGLGTASVSFVAKNSQNQNVTETLTVNVTAPVATKLNIPVSEPQNP